MAAWSPDPQQNLALSTAPGNQVGVSTVSDGSGGAVTVWRDHRSGTHFDIFAQRVSASGSLLWGANGVAVCTAANDQNLPTLVSDGAGGAIAVWEDFRSLQHDIYAQRIDATGAPLWDAGGILLTSTTGSQLDPQAVSGGAGGVIVAWTDFRAGDVGADVYVQRLDASGTRLWAADGVALTMAPASQFGARIAADGAGGAVVAWQDLRAAESSGYNIYAQRVDATGSPQWVPNGVAVCLTHTDPGSLAITSDGAAGAVIAWQDARNFDASGSDIYAQRVDASGVPLWAANGVAVCAAADQQHHPVMISTGAGGAVVAWDDARASIHDGDVYAQRVDPSGSPLWAAGGIPLSAASGRQLFPVLVSDGAGGAIAAWHDFRGVSGYSDIMAARVDPSGTALWVSNGVPVSSAAAYQLLPAIVASDMGDAIIAWQDARTGADYDVYAQRIRTDGTLDGVTAVDSENADAVRAEVWLEPATPNPASHGATTFRFGLPRRAAVQLSIHDAAGRLVRALLNEERNPGIHAVPWDGRGAGGVEITSGVYFLRLEVEGRVLTQTLVAIR